MCRVRAKWGDEWMMMAAEEADIIMDECRRSGFKYRPQPGKETNAQLEADIGAQRVPAPPLIMPDAAQSARLAVVMPAGAPVVILPAQRPAAAQPAPLARSPGRGASPRRAGDTPEHSLSTQRVVEHRKRGRDVVGAATQAAAKKREEAEIMDECRRSGFKYRPPPARRLTTRSFHPSLARKIKISVLVVVKLYAIIKPAIKV